MDIHSLSMTLSKNGMVTGIVMSQVLEPVAMLGQDKCRLEERPEKVTKRSVASEIETFSMLAP
jgi:hypothetical protein